MNSCSEHEQQPAHVIHVHGFCNLSHSKRYVQCKSIAAMLICGDRSELTLATLSSHEIKRKKAVGGLRKMCGVWGDDDNEEDLLLRRNQ